MTAESEANKNAKGTASKARAAKSATSRARQTTSTTANRAKTSSAVAASKAKSSARDAEKSAESSVRSAGDVTKQSVTAGWESGRQAVASTAGKAVATASTAWAVVKHRKAIAAGAAAGVVGLMGGAFAAGRHTNKPHAAGPLTRLTGGRI